MNFLRDTVLLTSMTICIMTTLVFGISSNVRDDKLPENINIKIYEYGNLTNLMKLSFIHTGVVPAYQALYSIKMEPPKGRYEFSYVRVHYWNSVSNININYNPNNSMLFFYIQLPFVSFPFGVEGYTHKGVKGHHSHKLNCDI